VALPPDMAVRAIDQLGEVHDLRIEVRKPSGHAGDPAPGGRGHLPPTPWATRSRPQGLWDGWWRSARAQRWSPWTPR